MREPGAAPDAVRPQEAASALEALRQAVRAAPALRAGPALRPAAPAVQVLRPAAEPDARVARQLAVALADVALRPAVPDVQERRAPGAASAFRLVRVLPSAAPVRRPAANFVRATLRWRTASPSAQSWQAARDEALS
ncbi:hypothetical protein JCM18382A_17940 [Bradyrhizobium sp. 17-4]